mmetsp:Transcript_30299/g.85462  ORF Transcript_30299/g.85462 Transcript_30299/m.85462 type:complete len:230 (-) Transcript_30299:334-1023(-)
MEATMPRVIFRMPPSPSTLTPTMSPPLASLTGSSSLWIDRASAVMPLGEKISLAPGRRVPVSTRPTITVPVPGMLQTLSTGSLSGFSAGRLMGPQSSRTLIAGLPEYQLIAGDAVVRFSPCRPVMGTNGTSFCLYPTSFKNVFTAFLISSNLAEAYSTEGSSSLVTHTTMFLMPMVKHPSASSRVRPLSMPASNSLAVAGTTRMATSAREVTENMFFAKSRWPGVSIAV